MLLGYRLKSICVSSGVSNYGIYSTNTRAVYCIGFTPSILDISQEREWAGHCPDATP